MKTYAETQGKAPLDWNAFLAKESYTYDQLTDARNRASSWVTCACGNQCDIIPRDLDGAPIDAALDDLGSSFYNAICDMRLYLYNKYFEEFRQKAISALHAIEFRSQEIINDLKNKK